MNSSPMLTAISISFFYDQALIWELKIVFVACEFGHNKCKYKGKFQHID